MGNSIGGRRTAKVIKIDGETFKLKMPRRVGDVIKGYPGHVLLDSEAVKHFGIRAEPLGPDQDLKPRKVYFLVELPKFPAAATAEGNNRAPRRVRSAGLQMSARERLECLMLSRRTSSDLSLVKPRGDEGGGQSGRLGATTVKMRISRAEMARLVAESRDEKEVAEKIMRIYVGRGSGEGIKDEDAEPREKWRPGLQGGTRQSASMSHPPRRRKQVRFDGGEILPLV
ncbi:hypothetical protein MLD38_022816 [Melastoma candidum]|uniref:Uncharacterized protein n=1 Tax=Melastoma candidum TaxID=119954 RepID=A0ACB9QMC3_9MYRT|nr:hypothetical protein MLD38_022816 [Melastoma candidum]